MERDRLLPEGSSPYGSTRDRVVIENYQGRQNIYNQPSLHEYEPLLTDSPVVVQTGGLFNTHQLLDENSIQVSQRVPSHYSGYAWLSMLFCCFPLSIAAIYKSEKVVKSISRGDLPEAWRHSEAAKKLSALAIIYGILLVLVAITLYFVISTRVTHTL